MEVEKKKDDDETEYTHLDKQAIKTIEAIEAGLCELNRYLNEKEDHEKYVDANKVLAAIDSILFKLKLLDSMGAFSNFHDAVEEGNQSHFEFSGMNSASMELKWSFKKWKKIPVFLICRVRGWISNIRFVMNFMNKH
jgi:hypothetical protein